MPGLENRAARTVAARLAVAHPGVRPVVRTLVELLSAAAFVVGVYELVVAGGIALWPDATDDWILPMWIAAATISGIGLKPVRRLARRAFERVWPPGPTEPYAALASFVVGACAAEPAEHALTRLAQLAASGTGARAAEITLVGLGADPLGSDPLGLDTAARIAGRWPDDDQPPPGERTRFDIRDGDGVPGALVLTAPPHRALTTRDLRLAEDVANAAGLLVRNADLTARLADEVRRQAEQTVELDSSRRRVLAARDAAREQLGREILARVGEPLYQCSAMVSALLDTGTDPGTDPDPDSADPRDEAAALAEMTRLIDTAIGDFRRIVHGVYPAVLTDHGLAAALENLLADQPRRTVFTTRDLPRIAPRIEAGVYFCVAALVASSTTASSEEPLEIRVDVEPDTLTVFYFDGARPSDAALPDILHDRVAALEAELQADLGAERPHYRLTVPLPAAETDAT